MGSLDQILLTCQSFLWANEGELASQSSPRPVTRVSYIHLFLRALQVICLWWDCLLHTSTHLQLSAPLWNSDLPRDSTFNDGSCSHYSPHFFFCSAKGRAQGHMWGWRVFSKRLKRYSLSSVGKGWIRKGTLFSMHIPFVMQKAKIK